MTDSAHQKHPMPLDGWPLSMAVRRLLPEFHVQVLAAALAAAEGMQDVPAILHYRWVLWPFLVDYVVRAEVQATGFRSGSDDRTSIAPTFFQDAVPGWEQSSISLGEVTFRGVRFRPHIVPQSKADVWMVEHATAASKRIPTIRTCKAETGASWRQAQAAWDALPTEIKGTPGKRKGKEM